MRLWTYATIERAEYRVQRRILTHRKWHECCPVEFNLAKVDNGTTQPHRCRVSDCITTTLAEQRQISPGELPIDRNAADRFFRQFKQLCEPRSIDQEDKFAHHQIGADYEPMAPSADDNPGKFECLCWRQPAKFGCLPAPKRDCLFGVAKFSDQLEFGSPAAGRTITSIRAVGARWIGLSHRGTPEGFAIFLSKPNRGLNFLQQPRYSLPSCSPIRRGSGRVVKAIDGTRRAQDHTAAGCGARSLEPGKDETVRLAIWSTTTPRENSTHA